MNTSDPAAPILSRILYFTGAATLSAATCYGVTLVRLAAENFHAEVAVTAGLGLASLAQFWMAEVLYYAARLFGPERARPRGDEPAASPKWTLTT